ncbi:hypothetical protein LXL04_020564 [Taraxacum kok-saghyz]
MGKPSATIFPKTAPYDRILLTKSLKKIHPLAFSGQLRNRAEGAENGLEFTIVAAEAFQERATYFTLSKKQNTNNITKPKKLENKQNSPTQANKKQTTRPAQHQQEDSKAAKGKAGHRKLQHEDTSKTQQETCSRGKNGNKQQQNNNKKTGSRGGNKQQEDSSRGDTEHRKKQQEDSKAPRAKTEKISRRTL